MRASTLENDPSSYIGGGWSESAGDDDAIKVLARALSLHIALKTRGAGLRRIGLLCRRGKNLQSQHWHRARTIHCRLPRTARPTLAPGVLVEFK
jgi:hypothetical protein